ncbi:MAG: hypothetical protein WA857_11875 [Candidatus Acidiferrum sp.]
MAGLEAWGYGHYALETEAQQTRSGQQNERQGNLSDDEPVTQDLNAAPARPAPALRLKSISEMPPKMKPSDRNREHEAHDKGCGQADQCHSRIKGDVAAQGQAISAQPAEEIDSAGPDGESEQSSG